MNPTPPDLESSDPEPSDPEPSDPEPSGSVEIAHRIVWATMAWT